MVEAERRNPHDGFERYEWCMDPQIHLDSPFNGYAAWLREYHSEFLNRLESVPQDHHPAEAHFSTWAAERAIAFLGERDPAPSEVHHLAGRGGTTWPPAKT